MYLDDNFRLNSALREWFLGDSTFIGFIEDEYLRGVFSSLFARTQELFRRDGVSKVLLYRWDTGDRCFGRLLESWSVLKEDALEFGRLYGRGELIVREVPVYNILFYTCYISEYYKDFYGVFGIYPSYEAIVVRSAI